MFLTIDEDIEKQSDKKTTYLKAGIFVVAMGLLGLVIYFFTQTRVHE